jgi:putative membrane protein
MYDPTPYYRPPALTDRPGPARHRWLVIGLAVAFIAVAALVLLLLFSSTFGSGSPSYPYHLGPFGGLFFIFFILVVLFFIVRVAFWSARAGRYRARYGGGGAGGYLPNRPAEVARMRYARGEITREQYQQILDDLRRPPGPRGGEGR